MITNSHNITRILGLTALIKFRLIAIARGHAQILVGVATYIGAYHLLGAYCLSTYSYKHIRLLHRVYGIIYSTDYIIYGHT